MKYQKFLYQCFADFIKADILFFLTEAELSFEKGHDGTSLSRHGLLAITLSVYFLLFYFIWSSTDCRMISTA